MPHMKGLKACQRGVRLWGQQMKIIALTGGGPEDDRRRTRKTRFDEQLIKPIQDCELEKPLARLRAKPCMGYGRSRQRQRPSQWSGNEKRAVKRKRVAGCTTVDLCSIIATFSCFSN